MNDDTCINCGKPHNGKFVRVMGMFKICETCESVGKSNDQLLKQGLIIEKTDSKTGNKVIGTYY